MKRKHGEVRGKVGILKMDIYQEKVVFLNINAWRALPRRRRLSTAKMEGLPKLIFTMESQNHM